MAMDFDLDDPLGDLLSDGSNDSFFGTSKKPEQTTTKKPTATTTTSARTSSAKVANLFGIDSETNATPPAVESTSAKSTSNLNAKTPQSPFQSADSKITSRDTDINTGNVLGGSRQSSSTPSKFQETTVQQPQPQHEPVRTVRKDTTQFDDSDDFLNELGFDPKHPKGGSITKKSNILDDILNFTKPDSLPKTTTLPPPTPMPTTPKSILSGGGGVGDTESRRSTRSIDSGNPSTNRYSPSLGSQGRPRRSGGSGPAVADPLGLFTTPTKKAAAPTEAKSTENSALSVSSTRSKPAKRSGIDWLGLGDGDGNDDEKPKDTVPQFLIESTTTAAAAAAVAATATVQPTNPQSVVNGPTVDVAISNDQSNAINSTGVSATTPAIAIPAIADMASANFNLIHVASLEKEQALHSLQQQQTQLRVAAQMKQQESMLHDMHRKQQMLIKQQENQFNELLQRQINRQSQLESHIQHQQEQINSYIGTLMSQPSIGMTELKLPLNGDSDHQRADGGGGGVGGRLNKEIDETHQHIIELEAEVKRLGLEKMRLEDTLQSVQSSHEQELDILHSSHKKQIALLDENLANLERRLRDEIKATETYHLNKIDALQTDMAGQQHKYDEQIEKLIGDYEKQIDRLRLNYEHDLEALQNDQRSTIENIRQAKLYEFAAVQESGSYLHTLKSASDNLEQATDNLQSMRTNIDSTIERIHAAKEVQLEAKEKRLNEQQKSIDQTVEKTEEERTRLIELIRSLEIKLNSVEQSATEEQWNLRQKAATLDAERVAFEREKTFTREKMAAEEKRIQDQKDAHLTEHKRLMDLLDAEREQILIEKAKLETMERLKPTSMPAAKRQTELDAAIQIAQDAAKSADTERSKFVEQQRQFEQKKRELLEKEIQLRAQQDELEMRIGQAKDQKQVAEHARKTCKALEQKLLAKLQTLQENYLELTEREAKLSQAKMELGKERMELQGLRQQLRQSKCSLCRIGAQNREISELDPLNDIDSGSNNIGDGGGGGGGSIGFGTMMDPTKPSLSSLRKFDIFSSNSFDGLQQRLLNVEAMIDDVIISAPQSPSKSHRHLFGHLNAGGDRSPIAAHSLPKSVIDPF